MTGYGHDLNAPALSKLLTVASVMVNPGAMQLTPGLPSTPTSAARDGVVSGSLQAARHRFRGRLVDALPSSAVAESITLPRTDRWV